MQRGGQPAHESVTVPLRGARSCYQKKNSDGVYVNDGKYFEWYPDEKIALTGEYSMGKKTGRWIEYDETGKKISDQYYNEGKEMPRP